MASQIFHRPPFARPIEPVDLDDPFTESSVDSALYHDPISEFRTLAFNSGEVCLLCICKTYVKHMLIIQIG
jgi:hypothetical protein